MQNDEPLLVSVAEAAKIMGVGRNTMLRFAKIKGFPALVLPHKILIDKSQLQNWISKNYGIYK
jgi:excisionase family DNA binding protein